MKRYFCSAMMLPSLLLLLAFCGVSSVADLPLVRIPHGVFSELAVQIKR